MRTDLCPDPFDGGPLPGRRTPAAPSGSRRSWRLLPDHTDGCTVPRCRFLGRAPRAERADDLARFRKPLLGVLGEDQLAVDDHVEDPVGALDELGLDAERLLEFGRQTGGPRQVLSTRAVGDRDCHRSDVSSLQHPTPMRAPVSTRAEPNRRVVPRRPSPSCRHPRASRTGDRKPADRRKHGFTASISSCPRLNGTLSDATRPMPQSVGWSWPNRGTPRAGRLGCGGQDDARQDGDQPRRPGHPE